MPMPYHCQNCGEGLNRREHNGKFAWLCPDCPVVVFEFIDKSDIDALPNLLRLDNNPGIVEVLPGVFMTEEEDQANWTHDEERLEESNNPIY